MKKIFRLLFLLIWNNVIDGEIVGENQVPDNKKITLRTDGGFIHEDEGGGGGIKSLCLWRKYFLAP